MIVALSLLLACPNPSSATRAPVELVRAQERSTREQFVALFAARDEQGCAALWRAHPREVLYTIDEDLEGALATWEKSPETPDAKAIAEHHARALWGARIASEVSGHPIFLDYASAFAGQSKEQKQHFRAGQRAHGESRKALKAKDFASAESKARECIEHAAPLGDWWGHAMGLSALGAALVAKGEHASAVAPLGEAALIYRDLQLAGDEYNALRALGQALVAAGAKQRAEVVMRRALVLAAELGDAQGKTALEAELARLVK
ncbi:MAG: hypothetical protein IT454_20700 [Planctomycetes bacterium]|nr:hypothetical protein [Planctomycetota bacterium]